MSWFYFSFLSAVCAILGDPGISYWDGNISKSVRVKKFTKFSSVQMYVGIEGEERGERSGSLPYFRRRQIVPHFTPKCPNLAHFIAVEPIVTRRFLKASLLYRNEPRHEIEARRFQPAPGNALKTKRTRAKSKVNELRSQKRVETEIVEIRFRAVKCSVTY